MTPGAGSRARSREIGYADAMAEMSELLDLEARKWQNLAGQQLDPVAQAIAGALGTRLRKLADYALGAAQVHAELQLMGVAEVAWDPRWTGDVPAELPQREHHESN